MTSPLIVSFESRRAPEMQRLIERHGAVSLVAPTLREEAVADPSVGELYEALVRHEIDGLVLLTGVGLRALVTALEAHAPREEVVRRLGALRLGARGPKVQAALKELGLREYTMAPEPYEWTDLLGVLEGAWPLAGMRLFLQEYGVPHPELVAALSERGAVVASVRVYEWKLPDDLAPIHRAFEALASGTARAALFTSAPQLERVLSIAESLGRKDEIVRAFTNTVVGSIGPSCSARLRKYGIRVDVEPEHSHMGHLVRDVLARLKVMP